MTTPQTPPPSGTLELRTEAKPGLRTTEFWLALIVVLAGALASVYAEAQWAKVAGIVSASLSAAGYGFARAQTKRLA